MEIIREPPRKTIEPNSAGWDQPPLKPMQMPIKPKTSVPWVTMQQRLIRFQSKAASSCATEHRRSPWYSRRTFAQTKKKRTHPRVMQKMDESMAEGNKAEKMICSGGEV